MSLLVSLVGVAGMAATYAIARAFGEERTARLAAVLFLCAPGVLIYSATSMDAVFMTVIALALAAMVRFPRSAEWAVTAGVTSIDGHPADGSHPGRRHDHDPRHRRDKQQA